MGDIATVTVSFESRPVMVDGVRAIAHTGMVSVHGGFVIEYEDGAIGEAVQGVHDIRFIDSAEKFGEICWEELCDDR